MAMAKVRQLVSLGLALLTTGCASGPVYNPSGIAASQQATVAGISLSPDGKSGVNKVDSLTVKLADGTNTTPVPLTAGWHDVTVAISYGSGTTIPLDLDYNFEVGKAYTVQLSPPTKLRTLCMLSSMWLADQDGKAVTPKQAVLIQMPPPMAAGMAAGMFGLAGGLVEAAIIAPMDCPDHPPAAAA